MYIQCLFVFCNVLDWRTSLEDEDQPVRKKARNTNNIYEQLKLSITFNPDTTFNETAFATASTSLEEGFSRLTKMYDIINSHKATGMNLYCTMGAELANLKFLKFSIKCNLCEDELNIYEVLSCKMCINSNKSNIKSYFKQVDCQNRVF